MLYSAGNYFGLEDELQVYRNGNLFLIHTGNRSQHNHGLNDFDGCVVKLYLWRWCLFLLFVVGLCLLRLNNWREGEGGNSHNFNLCVGYTLIGVD